MVRDGKYMPSSGNSVVIEFIFSVFVLLPVLILMIPLVIVFQLINLIKAKFSGSKKEKSVEQSVNVDEEHKSSSNKSKRDFDLILYGATGFTGRLAALHIAKQYGSSELRWVLISSHLMTLSLIILCYK